MVGVDESPQALSAEVEELLALVLLLFLGETVLGLRDLELALALERDETDTQICTTCRRNAVSFRYPSGRRDQGEFAVQDPFKDARARHRPAGKT